MSRCGYSEDCDGAELNLWRGAVESAIRGKRGQAFLKELLEALDALPEKKLIADELITPTGEVCAIGSVMAKRGISAKGISVEDADFIASTVGIAPALVKEIEFINDDEYQGWHQSETDEKRFERVRRWVVSQIKPESQNESH